MLRTSSIASFVLVLALAAPRPAQAEPPAPSEGAPSPAAPGAAPSPAAPGAGPSPAAPGAGPSPAAPGAAPTPAGPGSTAPPSVAAAPPTVSSPGAAGLPAAGAVEPGAPVVELAAGDERATIERRASTTSPTVPLLETGVLSLGKWEHVCASPCRLRLDPHQSYRVGGDGLVPSNAFVLPRADHARVDARMGSSVERAVGVLAVVGGALVMVGGGLAIASTPLLESEDIGSEGFRTGVLAGGIGAVSVGAISAAIGAFLWLSNGSTAHVEPAMHAQAAR